METTVSGPRTRHGSNHVEKGRRPEEPIRRTMQAAANAAVVRLVFELQHAVQVAKQGVVRVVACLMYVKYLRPCTCLTVPPFLQLLGVELSVIPAGVRKMPPIHVPLTPPPPPLPTRTLSVPWRTGVCDGGRGDRGRAGSDRCAALRWTQGDPAFAVILATHEFSLSLALFLYLVDETLLRLTSRIPLLVVNAV